MSAARRSRTCAASASPFSSTRANTISASTTSSRRPPPERRSLVDGAIVGHLFHSTGGERFERRSERGGGEPAGWRCRFRSTAPGTPQGSSVHLPPAWRKDAAIVVRPATSVTIRDGVPAGWRRGLPHTARTTSPHAEPRPTRTARTVPASSPEPAAAGRPRRPPRTADSAGPGADCRLRSRQPTRRPDLQSTSGTHVVIDPGPHERRPASGTSGPAGSRLDHDAFDLVERDRVRGPVVELRRLRRRVAGDPLRVLERPPVRQVRRDARRPKRVAARRRRQAPPPTPAA